MEIDKKAQKELLESFQRLKYDIEEDREVLESTQRNVSEKYAKYMTLRKVFEVLGIKYEIMEGDDQNAFI